MLAAELTFEVSSAMRYGLPTNSILPSLRNWLTTVRISTGSELLKSEMMAE
jgi:hypothetical protein